MFFNLRQGSLQALFKNMYIQILLGKHSTTFIYIINLHPINMKEIRLNIKSDLLLFLDFFTSIS